MNKKVEVRWVGPAPTHCDTCGEKIGLVFYDARTKMGPAACMCRNCQIFGPGLNKLGTGYGQEYTFQKDDNGGYYLKTAG